MTNKRRCRVVLHSRDSQSPLRINAFTVTLLQLCFSNRKNELAPKKVKIANFHFLIKCMSAISVFSDDVQSSINILQKRAIKEIELEKIRVCNDLCFREILTFFPRIA